MRLSDQRLMTPALRGRGVDGHNTPSAADLGIRRAKGEGLGSGYLEILRNINILDG
jgi:hypothetical protein